MKVLTSDQIRRVDSETMTEQKIESIELMERAAISLTEEIQSLLDTDTSVLILCGSGNNGGDGLAIARLLSEQGFNQITVWDFRLSENRSPDNQINRSRLPKYQNIAVIDISNASQLPETIDQDVIIDSIFGSGLSRPLDPIWSNCIKIINSYDKKTIAIDIPSGVPCSGMVTGEAIHADVTLVVGLPRLAMFLRENERYIGMWKLIDIGHSKLSLNRIMATAEYITDKEARKLIIANVSSFGHKGDFGHLLLIAGSRGMIGASILSAKAAMRAGVGKLTVHTPTVGVNALHISTPEAMLSEDDHDYYFSGVEDSGSFSAVAIGPGLGQKESTIVGLDKLLSISDQPMIIDADALNIIARKQWMSKIPSGSIITPHPGEFDRLFGKCDSSLERIEKLTLNAKKYQLIVVLKGKFTRIASPTGELYFNSTGSTAMATAGSGDVLTGIIASLRAQGLKPLQAALLGVYIHGKAGDLALHDGSRESVIASDLIVNIGRAFKSLS